MTATIREREGKAIAQIVAVVEAGRYADEDKATLEAAALVVAEWLRRDGRTNLTAAKKAPRTRGRGSKRQRPGSDAWRMSDAAAEVALRSGGACEHPLGCTNRATEIHHRRGRGFRDQHHPILLLHLCHDCHHVTRTHGKPSDAYVDGSMLYRSAPIPAAIQREIDAWPAPSGPSGVGE